MADNSPHLREAAECLRHAPKQDSVAGSSAMAQMALAHAALVIATELAALREEVEALREAVTDRDGFASADHLRNINEWVERIAKA
ncbi:hypothetical protein AB0H57_32715 [Micromonospora sp. NPDC050686]|uniref:hypothetical protein n=1 Tax=Micromonospora sp. NPDC050686 TaxID=3154631 RepID=UPI0033FCDD77